MKLRIPLRHNSQRITQIMVEVAYGEVAESDDVEVCTTIGYDEAFNCEVKMVPIAELNDGVDMVTVPPPPLSHIEAMVKIGAQCVGTVDGVPVFGAVPEEEEGIDWSEFSDEELAGIGLHRMTQEELDLIERRKDAEEERWLGKEGVIENPLK
jgi:hypothetical protein